MLCWKVGAGGAICRCAAAAAAAAIWALYPSYRPAEGGDAEKAFIAMLGRPLVPPSSVSICRPAVLKPDRPLPCCREAAAG